MNEILQMVRRQGVKMEQMEESLQNVASLLAQNTAKQLSQDETFFTMIEVCFESCCLIYVFIFIGFNIQELLRFNNIGVEQTPDGPQFSPIETRRHERGQITTVVRDSMDTRVIILEGLVNQTRDDIDSVDTTLHNLKQVCISLQNSLAGKATFNDVRSSQRSIQDEIALTRLIFEEVVNRVTTSVTTSVTDTLTSSILFRQLRGISQAMGQLSAREMRNRATLFANMTVTSTVLDEVSNACSLLLCQLILLFFNRPLDSLTPARDVKDLCKRYRTVSPSIPTPAFLIAPQSLQGFCSLLRYDGWRSD
jgi:hypothetical protein